MNNWAVFSFSRIQMVYIPIVVPMGILARSRIPIISTRIFAQPLRFKSPMPPITSGTESRRKKPHSVVPTIPVTVIACDHDGNEKWQKTFGPISSKHGNKPARLELPSEVMNRE